MGATQTVVAAARIVYHIMVQIVYHIMAQIVDRIVVHIVVHIMVHIVVRITEHHLMDEHADRADRRETTAPTTVSAAA